MPTAVASGFILDAYGRPYAPHGGLGNLHRRTREDDAKRPPPPNHYADYAALLAPRRFRDLVSEARAAASKTLVSALIESKSGYVAASHFRPRFDGTDIDFGARAMDWLGTALDIGNIRGARWTWAKSWRLAPRQFAQSEGFFVLLTTWPDTDFPAVQFIESHRVGQRDDQKCIVEKSDALTTLTAEDGTTSTIRGAYTGLRIHNGIITTLAGTEVAYRILGSTPAEDQDVSARDLIYVAAPASYSESRPAPGLSPALLDLLAIELAQTAQLDQQIADARRDLVEETPSGLPPTGAQETGLVATANGTPTEVVERGQYRFIKTGNKISAINTTRPSDQWMNFDLRVVKRASRAVCWAWEMLDPEALRGGATRAFEDQINTYIFDDFETIAPAAARVVRYFIAKAIQRGDLPRSADWRRFSIARPPRFTVDRASARIDLEELAAGRTSMSNLVADEGRTLAEVMRQRAADYRLAAQIAQEAGVDISVILGNGGNKSATPAADGRDNPQLQPAAA